ncbi:hypothetical protein NEOKW01_0632 [Nematocida sp. AWRm80]|nr:hypothetical protein NEOKW01_0632 [Nematocida sp. AWRm80]
MSNWKEYFYTFGTYSKTLTDLEFLQSVCQECSLHLYVEENRTGRNYMISGSTFVIDILYSKEEIEVFPSDKGISDGMSVGSSVLQIGKEKIESVVDKEVEKISLSLIEESWSKSLPLVINSLTILLRKKEYTCVSRVIKSLLAYDKEETDKENKGFGAIIEKSKGLEKQLGNKIGSLGASVDYSFLSHAHVLYWYSDTSSEAVVYTILTDSNRTILHGEEYSLDEMKRLIDTLKESSVSWSVISESLSHSIPMKIIIDKKKIHSIFGKIEDEDDVPESILELSGLIEGVLKKVYILSTGYIWIDGAIDKHRSILLKRTESIKHVMYYSDIFLPK